MQVPDISLSISERRPVCVLDPALALASRQAPLTVMRLAKLFELWVPRAFWQILDSSDYIEQQLAEQAQKLINSTQNEGSQERLSEYCDTIKIWQSLRSRRDTTGLGLRWLGDKLEESILGSETDWEAIQRYEALAQSILDRRAGTDGFNPISLEYAAVDAVALAAALGSRFLLALADPAENSVPTCCQTISSCNLTVQCIRSPDSSSLFRKEREQIRDLLAWGGATAWTVKGASIAVVQVIAPMIWEKSSANLEPMLTMDMALPGSPVCDDCETARSDYWKDAMVFWYLLD